MPSCPGITAPERPRLPAYDLYQVPSSHRRDDKDHGTRTTQGASRELDRAEVGEQAEDVGRARIGQQDCAADLGDAEKKRGLQRSDAGDGMTSML
jgi:hypothetical protein